MGFPRNGIFVSACGPFILMFLENKNHSDTRMPIWQCRMGNVGLLALGIANTNIIRMPISMLLAKFGAKPHIQRTLFSLRFCTKWLWLAICKTKVCLHPCSENLYQRALTCDLMLLRSGKPLVCGPWFSLRHAFIVHKMCTENCVLLLLLES